MALCSHLGTVERLRILTPKDGMEMGRVLLHHNKSFCFQVVIKKSYTIFNGITVRAGHKMIFEYWFCNSMLVIAILLTQTICVYTLKVISGKFSNIKNEDR